MDDEINLCSALYKSLQKRVEAQIDETYVARETTRSTYAYIAKIVLAFMFIFLLGGLFTYMLEVLPDMLQASSTTPESM